jgi:hypothetical protein
MSQITDFFQDLFYSNSNINEATSDNDTPTSKSIYGTLTKQTQEGTDMCNRMAAQLIQKMTGANSTNVVYKALLTTSYLLQYGHPDFYRAVEEKYETILGFVDWNGDGCNAQENYQYEKAVTLIKEKASAIVNVLRSGQAHNFPYNNNQPVENTYTPNWNNNITKSNWTVGSTEIRNEGYNGNSLNPNLTMSGISEAVIDDSSWNFGSIWSVFSSIGQSTPATSNQVTNVPIEEPSVSRYRPVQISAMQNSTPASSTQTTNVPIEEPSASRYKPVQIPVQNDSEPHKKVDNPLFALSLPAVNNPGVTKISPTSSSGKEPVVHIQNRKIPQQQQEEPEGSLFASLELTEQPKNGANSQFDFIKIDTPVSTNQQNAVRTIASSSPDPFNINGNTKTNPASPQKPGLSTLSQSNPTTSPQKSQQAAPVFSTVPQSPSKPATTNLFPSQPQSNPTSLDFADVFTSQNTQYANQPVNLFNQSFGYPVPTAYASPYYGSYPTAYTGMNNYNWGVSQSANSQDLQNLFKV